MWTHFVHVACYNKNTGGKEYEKKHFKIMLQFAGDYLSTAVCVYAI